MFIFPIPQLENYQTYAYGEGIFTPDECDAILGLAQRLTPTVATVGDGGEYNPAIRQAEKIGLSWNQDNDWIYQKLAIAVRRCNDDFYHFCLTGFLEQLELLHYRPGGFFQWHTDFNGKLLSIRKLSVVVQLSDPTTYEGGGLEIADAENAMHAPRSRGAVVVFPSFVMHRVMPVTAGERYSLVGWVSGPPFR